MEKTNVKYPLHDFIKGYLPIMDIDNLKNCGVNLPPDEYFIGEFAHYKQDVEHELIEKNFKTYGDFMKIDLEEFNKRVSHDQSYVIFRFLPACDNLIIYPEIQRYALKGLFDFIISFSNEEEILSNIYYNNLSKINDNNNQIIFLFKLFNCIKRVEDLFGNYLEIFKTLYENLSDEIRHEFHKENMLLNLILSQHIPDSIYSQIIFNKEAIEKAKLFIEKNKLNKGDFNRLLLLCRSKGYIN